MMKSCLLRLHFFADLVHFLVLHLRSKNALAAENLFLRKQLAFYQDRRIKPRRTSDQGRAGADQRSKGHLARCFKKISKGECSISTMPRLSGRPRSPPSVSGLDGWSTSAIPRLQV